MGKSKKKTQDDVMMEQQKPITAADITGISIWHDIKNRQLDRVVYSNVFMKDGYIITDDDAQTFSLYQSRMIVAEIMFIVLYLVTRNILISVIIPLVFYAIVSAVFFKKYLPTLKCIENYEKPKNQKAKPEYAAGKLQLYLAILISGVLVLSVLIAYIVRSSSTKDAIVSNVVFILVAIAMIIYGIIMMSKVQKNKQSK